MEARAKFVQEWSAKGMHYTHNCVFLDESGFDKICVVQELGHVEELPPLLNHPLLKGVSHTVIGAVSAFGVVYLSIRDPGNVKRRKVVGATNRKIPGDAASTIPKGTTAGHYLKFISDTLDIMDELLNMKGFHIIMDNAAIHNHSLVDPLIIKRGYVLVYLPPYSPELNPIEMLWKVLKDKVRQSKRSNLETLTTRITEGCQDDPIEHLQNFIQHSVNAFPKCLNKEFL